MMTTMITVMMTTIMTMIINSYSNIVAISKLPYYKRKRTSAL